MRALFSRLPPAAVALLLQVAAVAVVLAILRTAGLRIPPLPFALLCGALAAALARFAGLARWWLAIEFLFVPALVLTRTFDIPPGFFLAAFLILLAVYWSVFRSQVPLYLSSRRIRQALELLLPLPAGERAEHREPAFTFIDLGSGLGGVLTHLARVRPEGRYEGVEAAPLPLLLSRLRIRLGGYANCSVRWGSLWDCDLSQYDVVFAYLSPVPMEKLWHKARSEMRPGTVFISNTFAVPGHPPPQTFTVDDLHRSILYIWHM